MTVAVVVGTHHPTRALGLEVTVTAPVPAVETMVAPSVRAGVAAAATEHNFIWREAMLWLLESKNIIHLETTKLTT